MFPTEKRQNHADPGSEPASKSERKRAMHELQDLGEALIALDPDRLAALALPERLADAITAARGITKHEGRRRQLQFVGKLMRGVDAAPIKAALMQWQRGANDARARFARLEQWRDRLLAEPDALTHFVAAYPEADRATLSALLNDVRAERTRGLPPRKSRALFRALARVVDASSPSPSNATPGSSHAGS
jgi:ribosome-associated protein